MSTVTLPETEYRQPQKAGEYRYDRAQILGVGAFAAVYIGHHRSDERAVAVKRLSMAEEAGGASRFNRIWGEIRLMRRFRHTHIVQLYDVFLDIEEEAVYLMLEYCNGGNLAPFTSRLQLSREDLVEYARQIRDGLEYLHEQSILHRDLKPQNILLHYPDPGDQRPASAIVKIADFGLSTLTATGRMMTTICGSPLYMAPEILRQEAYTVKSDLWSLGVILYQLVYSRHPYEANSYEELQRGVTRPIYFPPPPGGRLSANGRALLKHLLTHEAGARCTWEGFTQHPWLSGDESSRTEEEGAPLPSLSDYRQGNVQLSFLELSTTSAISLSDGDESGKSQSLFFSIGESIIASIPSPATAITTRGLKDYVVTDDYLRETRNDEALSHSIKTESLTLSRTAPIAMTSHRNYPSSRTSGSPSSFQSVGSMLIRTSSSVKKWFTPR